MDSKIIIGIIIAVIVVIIGIVLFRNKSVTTTKSSDSIIGQWNMIAAPSDVIPLNEVKTLLTVSMVDNQYALNSKMFTKPANIIFLDHTVMAGTPLVETNVYTFNTNEGVILLTLKGDLMTMVASDVTYEFKRV